jgi:hypothetical protein
MVFPSLHLESGTTSIIPGNWLQIWIRTYASPTSPLQSIANISGQDDLKLLRLRTKKHEFMIVPDPKYIFVVVHEVSA